MYIFFWPLFFLASFSLLSVPSSFPSSSSYCAGDLTSPFLHKENIYKNFPQTTVEGLVHVDKTTKFHFGNIPWGRHILKNLERLQIVSFFFLTLQKVLQPARLRHRYCCFLESCRNQPHIWYHNNLVFSITKIGLLWNFNPIYAKL